MINDREYKCTLYVNNTLFNTISYKKDINIPWYKIKLLKTNSC